MKKILFISASVVVISILGVLIYFNNYLYSPFNFERDYITNADWDDYKLPMQIRYYHTEGGNRKFVDVTDPNEIRFVFGELKKGKIVQVTSHNDPLSFLERSGRDMLIEIRSGVNVLFTGMGWEGSGLASDTFYVEFTEELKELLSKRLNETKER